MTRSCHPEGSEGPLANASRRTLLLTLEYPPIRGGIASYLFALHQGLQDVVVHVPRSHFSLWSHWLSVWQEALRVMRKNHCTQLAISHVLPMGYIALLLRWFHCTSFFVFVHGLDLARAACSPWKRFWLRQILDSAHHIIANSEFTKKLAVQYGARLESVSVILPCVNTNVIARSEAVVVSDVIARNGVTKQSRDNQNKRLLLSVARLVPRKNHRLILEAVARLRAEFPLLRYTVVGDGPFKDSLVSYSRELEIGDLVEWRGAVTDEERAELYRSADIFVLPTKCEGDDIEGFGIVFLEAASYGIPVIAGRGGGVEEAVIDGQTGLLIDPTSVQELVDALRRLLRDQTYAQKLGAAARIRMERDFRCEDRRAQLQKIYQLGSRF